SLVELICERAALGAGSALFIEPFPGESSLICTRQVREIHNFTLQTLGTLIIRINTEGMVRQATVDTGNLKGNLLIYNSAKRIFASGPEVRTLKNRLVVKEGSGYRVEKINGRSFFVAQTRSSGRGWVYVNVLPYDTIFRPVIIMRTLFMAIFAVLLGVALIVSMKTARSLTKPIENLTTQMKKVETGDFTMEKQALPEVIRDDEVGQLQRDFLIMTQKINALIQENYTKQIVIKDTQLRALQAQINPHFLYNTMESINWLAKLGGQQEISRMVEALGNLMRSAMSDRQIMITLGRELELVRDYILIQQIRFGERLQFELDINDAWKELMIPKLTLQPIVENSIQYGLETVTGVCRIRITGVGVEAGLEIRVEDNGPGLDPEILRKLAAGDVVPEGNGIGLKNIDNRLQLMFGEGYGLKIESISGAGTVVRIRIPGGDRTDV
ncbi:MAG TPA: sensor histidine kinase, partial [Bacillota bacterium]|nr:sensor histidine kinase [Bacillota bacterium]